MSVPGRSTNDRPQVSTGLWAKKSGNAEFWAGSLTADELLRMADLASQHPEGKLDLTLWVNNRREKETHPHLNLYFRTGFIKGNHGGGQGSDGGRDYQDQNVPF